MRVFNLNYQVSLFGDYSEVTPTVNNTQKAFELFSKEGMIPNQVMELKVVSGATVAEKRLRLVTSDNSWRITFNNERLDFILTNIDLNVYGMPSFDDFVAKSTEYVAMANSIFPKSFRRIGIVQNLLINGIDLSTVEKKFSNNIPFFNEKEIGEWANRTSTRQTIDKEELNVVSDIRSIKTPVKMDSKQVIFDGLLVNLDINTLDENRDFRFNNANYASIIDQLSHLHTDISRQILSHIK